MITKLGTALERVSADRIKGPKSGKVIRLTRIPFTNTYKHIPRGLASLAGAGLVGLGLYAYHKHKNSNKK